MQQHTVLVVDDDREIARALQTMLTQEGFTVLVAYDGMEALERVVEHDVHLILLDIMMPRLDGLSTTMKIRESKNIPIIMLSAKSEDSDKILGLSIGADDYITKPFNPMELVARVKSQLRRYTKLGDCNLSSIKTDTQLVVGGLVLDTATKQVEVDGEPVKLTATEFAILELLMRHPGMVFPAEQIYSTVWHEDAYAVENTVMVHIRHIREKIEVTPREPKYLKVVWGIGYKIEKI